MSDNKENRQTRTQYKNDYAKNNYDRIALSVNKGKKEELKVHCSKYGYKSVNVFIIQAINEKIARDLEKM